MKWSEIGNLLGPYRYFKVGFINNQFIAVGTEVGVQAGFKQVLIQKKCIDSKLSKTQTYKMVDGKVEAGTEGYAYGNHEKFDHSTAMLLVDADFCRGVQINGLLVDRL